MTPLVLVPGMMCDARLFAPQIATLSGRIALMTMPVAGRDTMAELAAGILATNDPEIAQRLDAWRDALSASIPQEPSDD